jgi:hypothetical protein
MEFFHAEKLIEYNISLIKGRGIKKMLKKGATWEIRTHMEILNQNNVRKYAVIICIKLIQIKSWLCRDKELPLLL